MSNVSFFSYFNPCSPKHHAIHDFKNLKTRHKFAAVFAAIFAAVVSFPIAGFGGIAAFRGIVQHYNKKNLPPTGKKTQSVASSVLSSSSKPVSSHSSTGSISQKDFIAQFKNNLQTGASARQQTTVIKALNEALKNYPETISEKDYPNIFKDFKKVLKDYEANAGKAGQKLPYVSSQTKEEALDSFSTIFLKKTKTPVKKATQGVTEEIFVKNFKANFQTGASEKQQKTVITGLIKILASYGPIITKKDHQAIFNDFDALCTQYVNNSPNPPYISNKTKKEALDSFTALYLAGTGKAKPTKTTTGDFKALVDLIPTMQNPKKREIFTQGIKLYQNAGIKSPPQMHRLNAPQHFVLDATSEPSYFNDQFYPRHSVVQYTEKFYDYTSNLKTGREYWVDFANANLGGGCFDKGFVQEETMVTEIPDLALIIAQNQKGKPSPGQKHICNLSTRDGGPQRSDVYQGNPNPLLITGVHRVQEIKKAGGNIQSIPLPAAQKVNILAMAAPKLNHPTLDDQTSYETAKDLFNTIYAGFQLAEVNTSKNEPILIHSGRLGCGDYKNNPKLVYLLHMLAGRQLSIDLVMHGYNTDEVKELDFIWAQAQSKMYNASLGQCVEILADAVYNTG